MYNTPMSKEKEEKKEIRPKKIKSRISVFVQSSLPSEKEVRQFDDIIEKEIREDEIDENLSEIYKDENGDMINVKKLDTRKKKSFFAWALNIVFSIAIIVGLSYGIYYYYQNQNSGSTGVKLTISAPDNVVSGEEFFTTIDIKNLGSVDIGDIKLNIKYPDNYIFLDSSEELSSNNTSLEIEKIFSRESKEIIIKGKIIDKYGSNNIFISSMNYIPDNFSSEFKKEDTTNVVIKNIGFDIDLNYLNTALVEEENELILIFNSQENVFLNSFNIVFDLPENIEISSVEQVDEDNGNILIKKLKDNVWELSGFNNDSNSQELEINYLVKEKIEDTQKISIRLEKSDEGGEKYVFFEKEIELDIVKSDLNLTLILNGSKNDQTVNFGQKLNYSIVYANKGEIDMENVILMAVIEGDFVDWNSLQESTGGIVSNGSIIWTEDQIRDLKKLEKNEEGIIDFSINVSNFNESDLGKKFRISSSVQFSTGNEEKSNDNYSNTIISNINSDLNLKEEIRYFDEDNIVVGSGPLPPKAGEKTTFKVYWIINNNLHELNNTKVELNLPSYVTFEGNAKVSTGDIKYDITNHRITWDIGRLPIAIYRSDAKFDISISPDSGDVNKVLVLSPGSSITAVDVETNDTINKKNNAKTTKLEDDEIANISSDGRVE